MEFLGRPHPKSTSFKTQTSARALTITTYNIHDQQIYNSNNNKQHQQHQPSTMAFKKVLLLSLLLTLASFISFGDANDRERPPRTLSWFSSSSSSQNQVKTEQPSPQVQTPLPTVVPTVSTQSLRLPYVYSVRYYSDLSPQDRSKGQVLVGQIEGAQAAANGGAPCPYDDQGTRVAGVGSVATVPTPKERIAGYSYQYQTPTVVVPSPTVALTPPQLPLIQSQQQVQAQNGGPVILPMVQHHDPHHHHHDHEHHDHEHQPMMVPVMAPQTQPQLQQQQIPGSLLPFLQAAAAVATSSPHPHQHQHQHQHQGVVLPIYTVPQVAHSALATSQHQRPLPQEYQQLYQHSQQQQQHQQKVVPSVVGEYPYYYLYPEFVYVVPVLQQPQSSASGITQQHQQGVPVQFTQRHQQQHQQQQQQQQHQQSQHPTTMSVSGQQVSEDVRHHNQQQQPQQHQQQQQQPQQRQQSKQKQ